MSESLPHAGVLRRLGAMFYDLMLLIAVVMVVTALLMTLTDGEPILYETVGWYEYPYRLLMLVILVVFFGRPWTRSGQTLGMAAWRLRVQREDGSALQWPDVIKRLAGAFVSLAVAGLGYLWVLIDRDKLAWHDRWTGTRVVVLPKK